MVSKKVTGTKLRYFEHYLHYSLWTWHLILDEWWKGVMIVCNHIYICTYILHKIYIICTYIYIYIIYQHLNTVCSKREKWLDSIHQKDLPKRHQTPVSWDPNTWGYGIWPWSRGATVCHGCMGNRREGADCCRWADGETSVDDGISWCLCFLWVLKSNVVSHY